MDAKSRGGYFSRQTGHMHGLFFLVLPLYCYQPISLNPHAHMLSRVTPWAAARQAPMSMDFSRQEYWSGLPFPSPICMVLKDFSAECLSVARGEPLVWKSDSS